MATPEQTIRNPTTGETITFLLTAAETQGTLLRFEDRLPANHPGVPAHLHRDQEETFTVLAGEFHVTVNGAAKTLTVGESISVPAGVAHSFQTTPQVGVTLLVELRPALDYELFFETLAAPAVQKRSLPLQIALLTQELHLGFYLAGLPQRVQDVLFAALALLARWLGYRTKY
jgi:mannose-6-phosphate isomerase-like protein (cupin superfamily)